MVDQEDRLMQELEASDPGAVGVWDGMKLDLMTPIALACSKRKKSRARRPEKGFKDRLHRGLHQTCVALSITVAVAVPSRSEVV